MVITYYGVECFKVQFGNTTLAFNPISKESKYKAIRFGADIALVSVNHPDFNGVNRVSKDDKGLLVVSGPGEYEASGVFIRGFPSKSSFGTNTIYLVQFEDIRICFLGALSNNDLSPKTKEALDNIDILFVPIGGGDVLNAKAAHELAVKLEAGIVIPMHEKEGALKTFLKEEGEENIKPADRLTIKKKDMSGKEGEIVVLKPVN